MKIHINKTEQLNKMPSSLALFHLKIVIKETVKWTIVKLFKLMLWEFMALQTSSLPKGCYRQCQAFKNSLQYPRGQHLLSCHLLGASALQPLLGHLRKEVVSCGVPSCKSFKEKIPVCFYTRMIPLSVQLQHPSFKDDCGGCF